MAFRRAAMAVRRRLSFSGFAMVVRKEVLPRNEPAQSKLWQAWISAALASVRTCKAQPAAPSTAASMGTRISFFSTFTTHSPERFRSGSVDTQMRAAVRNLGLGREERKGQKSSHGML